MKIIICLLLATAFIIVTALKVDSIRTRLKQAQWDAMIANTELTHALSVNGKTLQSITNRIHEIFYKSFTE